MNLPLGAFTGLLQLLMPSPAKKQFTAGGRSIGKTIRSLDPFWFCHLRPGGHYVPHSDGMGRYYLCMELSDNPWAFLWFPCHLCDLPGRPIPQGRCSNGPSWNTVPKSRLLWRLDCHLPTGRLVCANILHSCVVPSR